MSTRNRTRVLAVVHSQLQREDNGVIDCSADLKSLSTSKTIKGTGGFSFVLVPRRNYLNLIFPNDVVNIYIDPGDGKTGFVRTMMGYIDRIEICESVNDQGATDTYYNVVGTDFAKAIEKTEIYFNPALANRQEFTDSKFGLSQLGGGHALRTSGVNANGTPAQLVENLLDTLLGYGTQWVLPRSYPTSNFLDKSRSARQQRAKAELPQQVQNNLSAIFGTTIDQIALSGDIVTQISQKLSSLQQNFPDDDPNDRNTDFYAQQSVLSDLLSASVQLQAYQATINETQNQSSASILDLLSLDFIEALSIDGYITSSSIWTNQGSLASMLYGWSNEIVNELCFDLRPVAVDAGEDDQCFGTDYSTEADELGYNVNGTSKMPASVAAIQYTPSVIMREYPYSTVEGLDLSKYYLFGDQNAAVGFMAFGPVFSLDANTPGRKIYNYQNSPLGMNGALTPEKCYYASQSSPLKHLDVVTITSSDDVLDAKVGRSDNDIFNLFELYASDPTQQNWKFLLSDIMPILTPISITRHGLRVRSMNTKFSNYSRDQLCTKGTTAVDDQQIRRNLIRWTLLLDEWNQHNVEYLSGTIVLRGRPDIRVGYRLDWVNRHESYYVESVQHQWKYPGAMTTTVQVSRGQRNDPFPAYIPPVLARTAGSIIAAQGGGDRTASGRLADFFYVRDSRATTTAIGGIANYSAENDIDKIENISGPAEFPGDAANIDQLSPTETLNNMSTSELGEDPSK